MTTPIAVEESLIAGSEFSRGSKYMTTVELGVNGDHPLATMSTIHNICAMNTKKIHGDQYLEQV